MGDEKKPDGRGGGAQANQSGPGGSPGSGRRRRKYRGGGVPPQSADTTKTGMSSDTKLVLGMVIAAIVATGVVVAVVVGTVLGSQILYNGTEIRSLAIRIDEARDDFHASVRAEIQALRSELAARVGPGHVDEMRRDHRRLHERMHNLEHELSEVDQSVRGLHSDIPTMQSLNKYLQDIREAVGKGQSEPAEPESPRHCPDEFAGRADA